MPPGNPRWLDIVRHRFRNLRAPYLLILQHHDISATTRLAVPVAKPIVGDVEALTPLVMIERVEHRARILDMTSVSRAMLGETVDSIATDADAVMAALDLVLHGYPVGRPT